MRAIRTISELREALDRPRREGRSLGLVPTMGSFHEGHLSIMRRARSECDEVVVSLFVNPAQFNDKSDLAGYPRDERRDAVLAQAEGVDYLFVPPEREMYPSGFATTVSVAGVTETLEGAHRGRGHFDGVATVVTKLLNIVSPHVAYFGGKDAQQAVVIERLARDLDIPVRIEVCPTIREPDGLALSSRNVLLGADERAQATALHRALLATASAVRAGEHEAASAKEAGLTELAAAGLHVDYYELVSTPTMEPVSRIDGDVMALVAARVGGVRLIDNERISPAPNTHHARRS
ncbi:MAG: pantoate--beta-alanine ligase [Actinomycetota bacterium]|nr:pantoate--beta-alanine ligase [Actinomycetota bacterium]